MRKKFLGLFIFIILFLLLLCVANRVFMFKEGRGVSSFYKEEKDSYDVILAGSSRMVFGIDPRILKEEYGIDSYNFAQYGQHAPLNYYYIIDAINSQHPSKVVLDVYRLDLEKADQTGDLVHMHESIDNMRWSVNKLKAIFDLSSISNSPQYFVPFIYYHTRWKELNKNDFANKDKTYFGYRELGTVMPYEDFEILSEEEMLEPSETVIAYLDKINDVCRDNNCELILINLPRYSPLTGDEAEENDRLQRMANGLAKYATERNIRYLNYNHCLDEMGFDFLADMYDENHSNIYGAGKQTRLLGEYLLK